MEDGHNVKNLKKKIAVMCAVTVTTTSVMAMPKNAEASFWESFSRWMRKYYGSNSETTTQETTTEETTVEETTVEETTQETTTVEETTEETTKEATISSEPTDYIYDNSETTVDYQEEETTMKVDLTPGLKNKKVLEDSTKEFGDSIVKDTSSLDFYYDGDNYRYAIVDGEEIIAFYDNGDYIDVLSGAGEYVIRDTTFTNILTEASSVEDFSYTKEDDVTVLTVKYNETDSSVSASTTYKFSDSHIEVVANIDGIGSNNVGTSFFQRNFINGYEDYELKQNQEWVFPENDDFPYKDFDSIVSTHYIDNEHKMYTFFNGDAANTGKYFDDYSPEHLPLKVSDYTLDSYELNYNLVFENLSEDSDPDYFALFKNKGYSFAAGITPVTESIENSTIFEKSDLEFNINISNISDVDKDYSYSYKIYDYYSNIYNETDESVAIKADDSCNCDVSFDAKNQGIYYLELTVSDGNDTHKELYPFGYLPEYNYEYRESSPFGISGIRFGNYQQNDTTLALMDKIGVANARVGISTPEYVNSDYTLLEKSLETLNNTGIDVTGQYLLMKDWSFSSDADAFQSEMEDTLDHVSKYLTDCEVGNETNLYPTYDSKEEAMEHYYEYEFKPGYNALSNAGVPIVASGVYQAMYDWMILMKSSGVWDMSSVLSTHNYGFPHSPDHVNDDSIEHSFESGLVRARTALDTYGDKTWYISEMGYSTAPLNNANMFSGVDLRTQADYTFREFILGLAYGADVIESYGFYDQLNMQKSTNPNDVEYHYGMLYDQDYFGRVMPKPWVLAYASMTRNLESVTSATSLTLSSSTIKAFSLSLEKDNETAFVLWSDCSLLSNDAVEGTRTPNLPWNNQWEDTEDITVYSTSTVTVTDIMGNKTEYTPKNNVVTIPVSGSPIIVTGDIYGAK